MRQPVDVGRIGIIDTVVWTQYRDGNCRGLLHRVIGDVGDGKDIALYSFRYVKSRCDRRSCGRAVQPEHAVTQRIAGKHQTFRVQRGIDFKDMPAVTLLRDGEGLRTVAGGYLFGTDRTTVHNEMYNLRSDAGHGVGIIDGTAVVRQLVECRADGQNGNRDRIL